MLNDGHLTRFIRARGIPAEVIYPNVPTPTVSAAAQALGIQADRIVKSLVFVADEVPVLIISAGEKRVSPKRLRDILAVPRRKLRMATPDEALRIAGFEVGAMPPFGHRQPLSTLLDSLTVTPGTGPLYGGGGTKAAMLKVDYDTLVEVTRARCLPLTTTGTDTETTEEEA